MPTPTERKVALLRAGLRQTDIARALGLSKGHVNQVINGSRRDEDVEREFARQVGMPVEALFDPMPERPVRPAAVA